MKMERYGFNVENDGYWRLRDTTDLIKQFNYVGFHDICIMFSLLEIDTYLEILGKKKKVTKEKFKAGRDAVFAGYGSRNSTGMDENTYCIYIWSNALMLFPNCGKK